MPTILVHITQGPEHPTRAALAFLVARSAVEAGHEVALFLAGDAVQLVRPAVLDNLQGLGTGRLREHFDVLATAGCPIYLSGMSSKSRGLEEDGLPHSSPPMQMAMPGELVDLALRYDRMFSY